MNFADRLAHAIRRTGSITCVGLDPRIESLPSVLTDSIDVSDPSAVAGAYELFCRGVIDAVADKVPCVKPQSAFFEALGPPGVAAMADVIRYARERSLLVIVDAKRNDIGSTALAYAAAYLGAASPFAGDALTVSPYLGRDSIEPFCDACDASDAGIFVLVKTSNPGGGLFQDRRQTPSPDQASTIDPNGDGQTLFESVADLVEELNRTRRGNCGYGPIGSVVGATYPEQLASLRDRMRSSWILIPGFGAQGGGADDVRPGVDANGLGAIVNSSRHLIFAHRRDEFADRWAPVDWQNAVAAAADQMNQQLGFAAAVPPPSPPDIDGPLK